MKHFFSVVALLLIVGQALAAPPAVPTEEFGGTIPNRPLITGHWSETANYAQYRPPAPEFVETDCPHQVYSSSAVSWSSTSAWEGGVVPTDGSDASIKNETIVLLSTGDIPAGRIYGTITIPESSALIFDDVDLELNVHGLVVRGSLQAGSLTCRLTRNITITLYGSRDAQPLPAHPQVKGIAVFGSIDIHGSQYFPTWTRLAMTVESTEDVIFLQDLVNWQVGQQIVITTTELKDSRDFTHTEVRRIANIYTFADDDTVTVIQVDSPLDYQHYAGVEYQAEVALLSRDIVIQGDPDNSEPTQQETTCHDLDNPDLSPATNSTFPCADSFLDGFGGHVQVIGPESEGRFRGVELYRMGQTNQMARYPLHFHLMYEKNETTALISDCSVHRSFYRCYVIHGTNNTLVTQNTAYDAIGNCFYLSENGVEERSTISYNFAAFVHPLGNPALPSYKYANNSWLDGSGFYGQYLDFFNETQDLLIPADLSAACFYITNGYNNIFGNAAAGGWTGFSYPSLLTPIADFKNLTNFSPQGRPFMSPFRGNTAHSTGFWWASAGAFYFGGQLGYVDDEKTILQYTAGRSQTHDTCKDSTVTTGCYGDLQEWLELEDNKAFLAHRGLQAWGNRADIVRMELHDVVLSMNVFGQVWIDHLLMECRSNHTPSWMANCPAAQGDYTPDWNVCNTRDTYFFNTIRGFQWYDVGQNHILTNSVFRNCRDDWYSCYYGPSKGKCYSSVFQSLTHSDEFVPENMQVTKNITFENCGLLRAYTTANTHNPLNQTVSGRLQNWVDYDGSVSGLGVMTQIGSNRSYHWWDYSFNGSCPVADEAYTCPMGEGDGQASIFLGFDWDLQSQVGGEVCSNGDTSVPCPVVGEVIHFGREAGTGLLLGVESKLSGPVIKESAGWFINLTDGTPKEVNFSSVIIANDFQLVLALPYPAGTKLNITYEAASWCSWQWATCSIPFKETTSVGKVYNGTGNLYYFADEILYIRIVMQPSSWPQNPIFGPFLSPANFSRDGLTLYRASQSYVSIRADCDTDPCAKVNVKVPPAINPRSSAESTSTVSTTSTSTTTRPTFTAISKTTSVTVPTSTNGGGDDDDNDHSGSGCFAASSSVRVLAGDGRILNKQLADLSVGDLVESFDGEERVFSPVYYIAHAGDEKKVNVVSLEVADTAALKLTPHHLLLVASNLLVAPELKPAGEVKVGEFLVLVSESGAMTRTRVVATKRDSEAVRNPLTLNNNIVVSGFACSAFAYSASFYSTLTRPAQILYQLLPSVFEPTSLLSLFVDALVVASDWFESKSFASTFVAATSW